MSDSLEKLHPSTCDQAWHFCRGLPCKSKVGASCVSFYYVRLLR